MRTQTPQKRELFASALNAIGLGVFAVFVSILVLNFLRAPDVVHAANNTLNFQARLESNTGGIAPDGLYNVSFHLFDASSSSGSTDTGCGADTNCLWSETYYDSNGVTAGNDNRVRIHNGYLTVNLGSQTSFPGTINWDSDLYITMNIGGTTQTATPTWDGQMDPRLKLTSVPYAFQAQQAEALNQVQGAYTGTLQFGTLSSDITLTLPTTLSTGDCLYDSGSGVLGWTTCGGAGGSTLQAAYTASTGGTTPEIKVDSTRGGVDIQDADTPTGGSLLTVRGSNGSGLGTAYFDVSASDITLGVDTTVAAGKTLTLAGDTTANRPTASGNKGMLYFDTDTNQLLQSNGTKWVSDRSTATKIVGTSASGGTSSAVASQNYDSADFVNTSTTSAQTTINAAIAALPASGGTVYLLDGTYIVDGAINIGTNVILAGTDNATVLKLANSVNAAVNVINATGASGMVIRNLVIDGNRANNSSGTQTGINLSSSATNSAPGILIDGVSVSNFRSNGMYMSNINYVTITRSYVYNNATYGVSMTGVNYASVTSNYFASNQNYALYLSNSASARITNNTAVSNAQGLTVLTDGAIISGNKTVSNTNIGIYVAASYTTVSGNSSTGDSKGISINVGGNYNSITGNTVVNSGGYAIYMNGSNNNNELSNNTITNPGGSSNNGGIYLTGSYNLVNNNVITDTAGTGYAIYIPNSSQQYNILSSNLFYGTGATSIFDLGTGTVYSGQAVAANGQDIRFRQASSSSAVNIQDGNGVAVLNVNTTSGQIELGNYNAGTNAVNGKISFNNSSNTNTVGLQSGATSTSYNLTLPTGLGSSGQCLYESTGTGVLGWTTCGGGGGGGATTALDNLSAVAINTSLLPSIGNNNLIDLGDSTHNWRNGYIGTKLYTPAVDALTASGTLSIGTANAATVNIATNAAAHTIAIANGAAVQGVTIGSTNTTSSLLLQAGTGNLSIQTQGGTLGIGTNAVAQTISVGNGTGTTSVSISSGTGAINVGTNAVAHTITLGNSTGATSVVANCGTGACSFGANAIAHTTTIGSATGAAATTIQSGTGALALQSQGTINIGTNAVAQTITVGNTTGATAATIQTGSGTLALQSQSTINIGANAVAQTIGIGNTTGATTLNLTAGTGGINLNQNTTVASGKTLKLAGDTYANISVYGSLTDGLMTYDTTNKQLLVYNSTLGKWQADKSDAILVAASNSSQADKNAADYVGNGNTAAANDGDQVEINQALTAAAGKKVVLLAGTYTVDADVTVPNNTMLSGVGNGTVITMPNAFNANIELIANADQSTGTGVTIRDLKLDGNAANQSSGSMTGIALWGIGDDSTSPEKPGAIVNNVTVTDVADRAIWLDGAINTKIMNSSILNSTIGIYASNMVNSVITGNTITDNTDTGIYSYGASSQHNTISSNAIDNNGYGIQMKGDYTVVDANTIANSSTYGISVEADHVTLSNNKINLSAQGGIAAQYSNYLTIHSNSVTATGSGFDPGIILYVTTRSVISGNDLSANLQGGIQLNGAVGLPSSDNKITGNIFYDNGGSGANDAIYLNTYATNTTITDNKITDTAGTGYAIRIGASTDSNTYLSGNTFSGTGATTINDASTSTIYAGQAMTAGGKDVRFSQGTTGSTSAFSIQGTSTTLFTANTSANLLQVGSNSTDATANLFILDSYNNGTDPTGYNGAMYYNTNLNKFRCYQNGAWTDCIGSGGGSGVTTVGALDGGTANANGATISGTTIYLQSADATYAGLVNTTAQTFGGDKTFAGNILGTNSTSGGATGTTEATARTNVSTLTTTADVFNVNDVVYIDNAGQDYVTRITVDNGGGSYDISPAVSYDASVTVTKYTSVQNLGATSSDYSTLGNRFFQGYFLGGVVTGAGSTTLSDGNLNSSHALTLQSSGNALGIGNTDPQRVLDVSFNNSATDSLPLRLQQNGVGDTGIEYDAGGSQFYTGIDGSDGKFKISSATSAGGSTIMGNDSDADNVEDYNAGQGQATSFVASTSGTINTVAVKLASIDSGTPGVKVAIYADNGGSPNKPTGTPLAYSNAYNGGVVGWNTISLTSSLAVTNGTTYWLAVTTDGGTSWWRDADGGITYTGDTRYDATSSFYTNLSSHSWTDDNGPNYSAELEIYANIATAGTDNFGGGGTNLLELSDTGAMKLQNSTDSVAAFQIQDASSNAVLTVDTLNGGVTINGVLTSTGAVAFNKGTNFSTTGTTNNAAISTTSLIRLTGASTQTLTGIVAGTDGQILTIMNAASQSAILKNSNTGSTAANRILTGTGSDLTLPTNASITLVYDNSSNRWRVVGAVSGSAGGGGVSALNGETGAVTIQGTTNQISVNTTTGTVTLSTPQDINTTSNVTFGSLVVGSGGNTITLNGSGYVATGTYRHTKTIKIVPEFPSAVFSQGTSGNGHIGFMTSDYDSSSRHNYYAWTTDQGATEDYEVVMQYQLPSDFDGFVTGSNTFKLFYRLDAAGNSVKYDILDTAGTDCYSSSFPSAGSTTGSWTQASLTDPGNGCSFAANDIITIKFRLASNSSDGSAFAQLSTFQFDYKAKF